MRCVYFVGYILIALGFNSFAFGGFEGNEFNGISIDCPLARKSAPPVSAAYIVRVISAKGGFEEIEESQSHLHHQHNSKNLKVVSAVCGYGGTSRDSMLYAGSLLKVLKEIPIDNNRDGIADGFLILWDLEGKSLGGTLHYKAFSANGSNTQEVRLQMSQQ